MTAQSQEPGSICVGCGLCCDGTLHGWTTIHAGDQANVAALSLQVEEEGGQRFFRQPCPLFAGGACSVYVRRPDVCRGYRCALLQDVDNGAVSSQAARETILLAHELIKRVRVADPDVVTPRARSAAIARLKARLTAASATDRDSTARKLLDLMALRHLLDRSFLRDDAESAAPSDNRVARDIH